MTESDPLAPLLPYLDDAHDAACRANVVYTAVHPQRPHPCDCGLGAALAEVRRAITLEAT